MLRSSCTHSPRLLPTQQELLSLTEKDLELKFGIASANKRRYLLEEVATKVPTGLELVTEQIDIAAMCPHCVVHNDSDIAGANVAGSAKSSSLAACAALCLATPACGAASWNGPMSHYHDGTCNLHCGVTPTHDKGESAVVVRASTCRRIEAETQRSLAIRAVRVSGHAGAQSWLMGEYALNAVHSPKRGKNVYSSLTSTSLHLYQATNAIWHISGTADMVAGKNKSWIRSTTASPSPLGLAWQAYGWVGAYYTDPLLTITESLADGDGSEIIKKHDDNGDGKLDGAELFATVDADGDGKLDGEELAAANAELNAAKMATIRIVIDENRTLTTLDTDKSGSVDTSEIASFVESLLTGSTTLDSKEAKLALARAILAEYDIDGSGTLDASELAASKAGGDKPPLAAFVREESQRSSGSSKMAWILFVVTALVLALTVWAWRRREVRVEAKTKAALDRERDERRRVEKEASKQQAALRAAKKAATQAEKDAAAKLKKTLADAAANHDSDARKLDHAAAELKAARKVLEKQHAQLQAQVDDQAASKTARRSLLSRLGAGRANAPPVLTAQNSTGIANDFDDFDVTVAMARAELDNPDNQTIAGVRDYDRARRAILAKIVKDCRRDDVAVDTGGAASSGRDGLVWKYYDTSKTSGGGGGGAAAAASGTWRKFSADVSSLLTNAYMKDNKDRAEVTLGSPRATGTVMLRQMVMHRHSDNTLLSVSIEGVPSPAITPPHWTPQQENEAKIFTVPAGSDEYKYVEASFQLRAPSVRVVSVQRVQDIDLWQRYRVQKDQRAHANGGDANERWLFHGTGGANPKLIWHDGDVGVSCRRQLPLHQQFPHTSLIPTPPPLSSHHPQFDARMSSDGYFGTNGAYFSESAHYSDRAYTHMTCCGGSRSSCGCSSSSSGHAQMFLASVVCGKSKDYGTSRDDSLKRPPPLPGGGGRLYASINSAPDNRDYRMFVVWNNAQVRHALTALFHVLLCVSIPTHTFSLHIFFDRHTRATSLRTTRILAEPLLAIVPHPRSLH